MNGVELCMHILHVKSSVNCWEGTFWPASIERDTFQAGLQARACSQCTNVYVGSHRFGNDNQNLKRVVVNDKGSQRHL